MRFFYIKLNAKTHPQPETLSQRVDDHWKNCIDGSKRDDSRKKSLDFLRKTFSISKNQPDYEIVSKVEFLVELKKSRSSENYMPSINDLPADTNNAALFQKEMLKNKCLKCLDKILIYSFENDSEVRAYCQNKVNIVKKITVLELMEQLNIELVNILYGVKFDPVIKALENRNESKIEEIQASDATYGEIKRTITMLNSHCVQIMEEIPMEKRAFHYRENIDTAPFLQSWDDLWTTSQSRFSNKFN